MGFNEGPEIKALIARLEDLVSAVERGELGLTPFLTPRELYIAEDYLTGCGVPYAAYGGYSLAERKRIYIFPDYMEELSAQESQIDFENKISEYGYSTNITPLSVRGSGYRQLTHRDFLGSAIALGVERSIMGDIVLLGDEGREAVIFCDGTISEFFLRELVLVANDRVMVTVADMSVMELPAKKTAPIHDTVAAPRLDALVAALCGLSREKGRVAVTSGLVELNFECEDRPDKTVSAPALISVRGFGRFKVVSLSDKTRKGRFRLEAEKFI